MNYLLVHGACHDGWCWHLTQRDLEAKGHHVLAPDLPFDGFESDVAAVAKCIDASPEPLVVAGHSYGGLVISAAAHGRENVAHLVYVAALLVAATPEFAEIAEALVSSDARESMVQLDDGRALFSVNPERIFYNTTPPDLAREAVSHLRPMQMFADLPSVPEPWRDVDTTYVLCAQDRAIEADAQRRMAVHANRVVEIDTDHSPFFSTPAALLDALTALSG